MNWNNIISLRMKRLGFTSPAGTNKDYDELFRRLQPVSPEYFTEPGQPPSLRDRADFDDIEYNRVLRQNQDIIKARFQGGTISYVLRDDLELYAAAFAKPLTKLDDTEMELFTVLDQVGPMDKKQIMEELDLKGPAVTKIIQKFQKAFMVYELQPDRFGEQVWQTFSSEWPEFNYRIFKTDEARRKVVLRFIRNMVAVDSIMTVDWTRFSKKIVSDLLNDLESRGLIESVRHSDRMFYFRPEDKDAVLGSGTGNIPRSVFVIHKADYLYRAFESLLKAEYKGKEILQYLLIDGKLSGAVEGHWRIGPHDIDNIIARIPDAKVRRDEIIRVVSGIYHPPYSNILRYNGERI